MKFVLLRFYFSYRGGELYRSQLFSKLLHFPDNDRFGCVEFFYAPFAVGIPRCVACPCARVLFRVHACVVSYRFWRTDVAATGWHRANADVVGRCGAFSTDRNALRVRVRLLSFGLTRAQGSCRQSASAGFQSRYRPNSLLLVT